MHPSPVEQLKALRLTGMLEAWSEQQSQPTYHDLSFDERLSLLVEREHLRRVQQRLQKRLKQAHLSTSAGLSDIDFSVPRDADAILDRIVRDSLRLLLKGESMQKLTSKLQPQAESA